MPNGAQPAAGALEKHRAQLRFELGDVAAHRVCDYIFFLGYSGVVLAESFARLDTPRTLLPAWGFHDGDLFALGRKQGGGFTRLCK